MTTHFRSLGLLSSSLLVVALAGCGGSKKPAASPASAPAASASAAAPEASAAPAPAASASAAPAADNAAPDSDTGPDTGSGPGPSQPPIDLITQTDEAFVLDFKESDIGVKADKECKSGSPAKVAKCMKRKRAKFVADVLQFKKKGKKITFTIYKRRYKRATHLSTNKVKLTQKSPTTVAVEVLDSHKRRVLFSKTNKFVVTVPNDYSIQLNDPKFGKLVYDGKVGILGK